MSKGLFPTTGRGKRKQETAFERTEGKKAFFLDLPYCMGLYWRPFWSEMFQFPGIDVSSRQLRCIFPLGSHKRYLPLLHPALYTFLYKASSVTSAVCLSSASLVSRGEGRSRKRKFFFRETSSLCVCDCAPVLYRSSFVRQQACLPYPGPGEATGLAQRQVCIVFPGATWCGNYPKERTRRIGPEVGGWVEARILPIIQGGWAGRRRLEGSPSFIGSFSPPPISKGSGESERDSRPLGVGR